MSQADAAAREISTGRTPRASVVVATRNRRAWLHETIASVQAQSLPDWELIVVDDASEDDTWESLGGLGDARVRPIRLERHSERSRARNLGLDASRARYVLFLDDDDRLPAHALARHVRALEQHPHALASAGGHRTFGTRHEDLRDVRRPVVRWIAKDILLGWMAVAGQTLFRAEIVRQVGGWTEGLSFAEDHDLWLRVATLGPVVLLPDIVLEYRVHGQPRPDGGDEVMTEIRARAVARLTGGARRTHRRALRAWMLGCEANARAEVGDRAGALCRYAAAVWAAPRLLWSPRARRTFLWRAAAAWRAGAAHRIQPASSDRSAR